ncbi:MAG TPA: V-type ATPase subunit [Spirochaetota bacterium]|nr:V-type ATPase subunit [Spirochaetota bacterium]
MNYYADSNYIHAKIYALHGLLLARRDYYNIAKNLNFQSAFPGLDTGNIKNDFTVIKEKIFESQVSDVISLAESPVSSRGLFLLFLRCFETQNLKLLCAEAFGLMPSPSIWYDIGDFAVLHRSMLQDITGIEAVVELTRDTWMKNIFVSGGTASLEETELVIDREVLRIAADFPYLINFQDRSGSLKLVSGLAVYLRMAWSRRLQHIYRMDQESISKYIESNLPLPESTGPLKQYIEEWNLKFLKQVNSKYTPGTVTGGDGLSATEKIMEQIILGDISRMFRADFHSINTVTCYLVLLYRQIRNLFSIVDGLRFGLPPDVIMENIICEV